MYIAINEAHTYTGIKARAYKNFLYCMCVSVYGDGESERKKVIYK